MTGGELRCPACREIEWFRDGVVCVEEWDGTLVVERVTPARWPDDGWSCMACGYEVPPWCLLDDWLDAAEGRSVVGPSSPGHMLIA